MNIPKFKIENFYGSIKIIILDHEEWTFFEGVLDNLVDNVNNEFSGTIIMKNSLAAITSFFESRLTQLVISGEIERKF